ncbi:unnamed protein product [Sympodiomycopsis kandeliae]
MNAKAAASRYQRQVLELSRQPGNEICADCGGRNPRWASHNLGIFLCVQCAGVHRKMGTHISKIKSLTLDEWSKEQVERMKEYGNLKSNSYYNPNEKRNRPPTNVDDYERDNELEKFIRNKYEFRRFMDRNPPPVPRKDNSNGRYLTPTKNTPTAGSSRSVSGPASLGSDIHRSRTAPIPATWKAAQRAASPLPAIPTEETSPAPSSTTTPSISVSTAPSSQYTQNSQSNIPNSLSTPSLPQRSSSAIGYASGSPAQGYANMPTFPHQQPMQSPSTMFPQQQPMQSPSTTFSHQQAMQSPSISFPQQPQQQQQSFAGRSQVFDDLLSLNEPQPPPQQQQQQMMTGYPSQPQMMQNPWSTFAMNQQAVLSPQQMGHQAFQQQQPMMAQGQNPFLWQQQQQQPQYQYQQQQQYYQQQPQDTAQQYQQQRLQTGQVFDDWAKGMMPGRR